MTIQPPDQPLGRGRREDVKPTPEIVIGSKPTKAHSDAPVEDVMDGAIRSPLLDKAVKAVQKAHLKQRNQLSVQEWFNLFTQAPKLHGRNGLQYVADAVEHFGSEVVHTPAGDKKRYGIFSMESHGGHPLRGHEAVQEAVCNSIKASAAQGRSVAGIMLIGPNGSGKDTIWRNLEHGLERYSQEDEGALYRFYWLDDDDNPVDHGSNDHPIFLIPKEQRQELLARIERRTGFRFSDTLRYGELSGKNQRTFDELVRRFSKDEAGKANAYQHVLNRVRVERYYLSRRRKQGLVPKDPKSNTKPQDDVVRAFRGMLNYKDLLKQDESQLRDLLGLLGEGELERENGVHMGDVLLVASANDVDVERLQKEQPGLYQAFLRRVTRIRTPQLLDYQAEAAAYRDQIKELQENTNYAPHVQEVLALWSVMARLRPAEPSLYGESKSAVAALRPVDKARLYAEGRAPRHYNAQRERELLRVASQLATEDFDSDWGSYEGAYGCSLDALASHISRVAKNSDEQFTVPALLDALESYWNEHEDEEAFGWMRQGAHARGYHSVEAITAQARAFWLERVQHDAIDALGILENTDYDKVFADYAMHAQRFAAKRPAEKIPGRGTVPDPKFMEEIESIIAARGDKALRDQIANRVSLWMMDNPGETPPFRELFPQYLRRLERNYFQIKQDDINLCLEAMHATLSGEEVPELSEDSQKMVDCALAKLTENDAYTKKALGEALGLLIEKRSKS